MHSEEKKEIKIATGYNTKFLLLVDGPERNLSIYWKVEASCIALWKRVVPSYDHALAASTSLSTHSVSQICL